MVNRFNFGLRLILRGALPLMDKQAPDAYLAALQA